MTKRWALALLFSFFLVGCSQNVDAENPADMHSIEKEEIFIEKESSDEPTPKKIQLAFEENSYPFSLQDYPILSSYVYNFDHPEEKLRSLPFLQMKEHQYLVEFACHKEKCSHLVIDFQQKRSFLLSDLSSLKWKALSLDQKYAAFLFARTNGNEKRHQLTVMDLDSWEPVDLQPAPTNEPMIAKPNHYQYSIHSVTFMGEDELQIISDPMNQQETDGTVTSTWIYR